MVLRIIFIFILLLVAYIASAFANPFPAPKFLAETKPHYGFTYGFEDAGWYGLDPKKSYVRLLDEVDFDWVRLSFFWDEMTDEDGNLTLDDLVFAIEEAQKRDVKVVIALGAKTPSYPEFHWPKEVADKVKFGEVITASHPVAADILEIDKKVVERLAPYKNIAYWQVENEPYLANINNWKIDKSLLAAEAEVVRNADPPKRPVILNHVGPATVDSRYRDFYDILQPGDVLAVNSYFKTQGVYLISFEVFGKQVNIGWPRWLVLPVQSWLFLSPNYKGLEAEANEKGLDFWILEVQAEPYIRDLADAQGEDFSFTAEDLVKADAFIRSHGVNTIGFWGAPFWLYREQSGDESWMNAAKKIVNRS